LVVEPVKGVKIARFDGPKAGKDPVVSFEEEIFGLREDFGLNGGEGFVLPEDDIGGFGFYQFDQFVHDRFGNGKKVVDG
jgi:hypothetical protein